MELEVERNHIRCSLSAGEKFNSLLVALNPPNTALTGGAIDHHATNWKFSLNERAR